MLVVLLSLLYILEKSRVPCFSFSLLISSRLHSSLGLTTLIHPPTPSPPAGGIAPKILPAMLDNSLFYANLVAKGRMKSLLSAIPVYIVTHPQVRA